MQEGKECDEREEEELFDDNDEKESGGAGTHVANVTAREKHCRRGGVLGTCPSWAGTHLNLFVLLGFPIEVCDRLLKAGSRQYRRMRQGHELKKHGNSEYRR